MLILPKSLQTFNTVPVVNLKLETSNLQPSFFMLLPEQTPRQRIREILTDGVLSARELAQLVGIPERQVEDHLTHILKSVSRDQKKQFLLTPSVCQDCGFVFQDRKRLTCPSRCPECRSEGITPPRFEIRALPG